MNAETLNQHHADLIALAARALPIADENELSEDMLIELARVGADISQRALSLLPTVRS